MTDSIAVPDKTQLPPSENQAEMLLRFVKSSLPLFETSVAETVPTILKDSIDALFTDLTKPIIKTPSPPQFDRSNSQILGYEATRAAANREAVHNYEKSCLTALTTLKAAMAAWESAISDYKFADTHAMATAQITGDHAVADYNSKIDDDSKSRKMYIYESMAVTVGSAIESYEASLDSAASSLAGEAGTLVMAQITYLNALRTAAATCLTAIHTAEQTFWQSAEAALDSASGI